jgi:hypoxanthine phosphoribosyltransferase
MKASSNELRKNTTTWQTMSLCSSNASVYEKLNLHKNHPDGEMMRLLEYKIETTDAIPTDYAKQMFDFQLLENYGHAGPIYIQWVINNLEDVKRTLKVVQEKVDRELKLTQRERFWSAKLAANLTGGMIARRLKIIDWDMQRIYAWATSMVFETREDVEAPHISTMAVLGDYLNRNIHNILVVDDGVDSRSNLAPAPLHEPRGALYARFEPDTKRLFLDYKHFREECIMAQINYKEVIKDFKKCGAYIGTTNKRLSKGMAMTTPSVYCIEFDTSVGDFLDMGVFVPESEGAD